MKKQLLFLIFLLCSIAAAAQDYAKSWEKVILLESDGKIKSANREVSKIYRKAVSDKNDPQLIKSFFYRSKYLHVFEIEAQTEIISNLEAEIKRISTPSKALLHLVHARCLNDYYLKNRYSTISRRVKADSASVGNFLVWNSADFMFHIDSLYTLALQNETQLKATPLQKYEAVFDFLSEDQIQSLSVYDYLLQEYIDWEKSGSYSRKADGIYDKFSANLFGTSESFIHWNTAVIPDKRLRHTIHLYQQLEASQPSVENQLNRMQFCYLQLYGSNLDFLEGLEKLRKLAKTEASLDKIRYKKAELYQSLAYKGNAINYNQKAITILDSIVSAPKRSNAYKLAQIAKKGLESREITIQMERIMYPDEIKRALITYKNAEEITLVCYKISQKQKTAINLSKKQDSLISDIRKKNPVLKKSYGLVQKKDCFHYSTEILLPALETGTYLVVFESDGYATEKASAYQVVTVSRLNALTYRKGDNNYFQLVDQKSGKPVANVQIQLPTLTLKTDRHGLAFYSQANYPDNRNNEVLFIAANDTLMHYPNYGNDFLNTSENNTKFTKAKVNFYLDRAIYRPGQTVYYKGIAVELQNKEKSVVPFTAFSVEVKNANYETVTSFEATTNAFGSFSGSFVLPTNGITGTFQIEVSEPNKKNTGNTGETKDPFWSRAELQDGTFRFSVEEYKRPKFEVAFDKLKENPVIGKPIKLKGTAKALAGSVVTGAKVSYTVTRKSYQSWHDRYEDDTEELFEGETTTDANGNFEIGFTADPDDSYDKKELPVFEYEVKADVTDTNGETRSAEAFFKVGYHALQLDVNVPSVVAPKSKDVITLNSTSLNGGFVAVDAEIKVYFIRTETSFKKRVLGFPDIQNIPQAEFERLFPYEQYKMIRDTAILVYSKKINTGKQQVLSTDFTAGFKSGYYKIAIHATDSDGNAIMADAEFELLNNTLPYQPNKLLHAEQLNGNPEKDGYIKVRISSPVPELFLQCTAFQNRNAFYENNSLLQSHRRVLEIPIVKNFDGTAVVQLETVFENNYYSTQILVNVKKNIPKLEFGIESFRNKIEPGSTEKWSFAIKGTDQEAEAEILASMYDSSLDAFAKTSWSLPAVPDYSNDYGVSKRFLSGGMAYLHFSGLNANAPSFQLQDEHTQLAWFGFNFSNTSNQFTQAEYRNLITKKSRKPHGAGLISGIVSDAAGTLPGANVIVKGTTRGTQTDIDGYYEIVAAAGEELVFSFIGMEDLIIRVGQSAVFNAKLQAGDNVIAEVVVGALGIKRTKDSVVSAQQVSKANKLTKVSNAELIQALAGKVSGIQVNTVTEHGNTTTRIVLRGNRSLTGNNQALIVIDGVITGMDLFQNMSPEDIASIDVIKGAQGAALYGSEGSNGVIIITTKKAIQELIPVKTRTNLSETAFFFPDLKTDASGKVSFSFASPEALTRWKFRMLAHTKKTISGYHEESVVTQKEIMVLPNLPRFLRENDTITIRTKIANLTGSAKTGVVMLQLFDAATMESIDITAANEAKSRNFSVPPMGNADASWKIIVPKNIPGLHYRIVARSGNFSDGEESILPVLTNSILMTESIPLWVRENSKKEVVFENLKHNTSKTLRNHMLTLEYTTNPTWLAIQSLPYLMEYEHECAEQTFARYYANVLAASILEKNPKIAAVFDNWRQTEKPIAALEQNQELKNILLAETPWITDALSETEKKRQLAVLFDLDKMKNSGAGTFKKLLGKQKSSGGFGWFDGGAENEYITRHILAGLGHLEKLDSDGLIADDFGSITDTAIPYVDNLMLQKQTEYGKTARNASASDLHYLYMRSFYSEEYPLSEKLKATVNTQLQYVKANWLALPLYEKGMAALALHRFGEKATAKKIVESLKETAATNTDWGMFWIENKSGWFWSQAPIETQALLIEAFSEISQDIPSVDAMKVWLLKNKQQKNWPTTRATTEAVYALLLQGSDWTAVKDNTKIQIGDEKISTVKLDATEKESETGYIKLNWNNPEIKPEMAVVSVANNSKVPGYGGIYWQYFEDLDQIKTMQKSIMNVGKELYAKQKNGAELVRIDSNKALNLGELVTARLIIKVTEDMEFVHLKDMRASCFEPVDVLSAYKWSSGLGYYQNTRDAATHFFFDAIKAGTYVLEYDMRVSSSGDFSNGITTIQSMYAPEFTSHTKGIRISVSE